MLDSITNNSLLLLLLWFTLSAELISLGKCTDRRLWVGHLLIRSYMMLKDTKHQYFALHYRLIYFELMFWARNKWIKMKELNMFVIFQLAKTHIFKKLVNNHNKRTQKNAQTNLTDILDHIACNHIKSCGHL